MNLTTGAFSFLLIATLSLNASATSFNPANATFAAPGVLVIKPQSKSPFTCNMLLAGHTNSDDTATITSVSFSTEGQPLCSTVSASGLPWTWKAVSVSSASLMGVKINAAGVSCSTAPVTLSALWSNSTDTLTLTPNQNIGNCVIQALAAVPSPPLTVIP